MPELKPKIKVLIVDDSAMVRKILGETIAAEADMEVVGTAPDPFIARDKIVALRPDVLTLDLEMPHMNGLIFLRRLMSHTPIPTIIISSLGDASYAITLEALRLGALDILAKPAGPYSVGDLRLSLAAKIRAAAGAKLQLPAGLRAAGTAAKRSADTRSQNGADGRAKQPADLCNIGPIDPGTVIAIGASTGGTVAIQEILQRVPADMPPIMITQHIPAGFSRAFADRLNKLCAPEVREAKDGDTLRRGLVLVAPGDYHMLLRRAGPDYVIELQQGPAVCYQRPSADVMFASVAQTAGSRSIGVLLTGMGTDGAKGMLALHRLGAPTIAQDEASCVVYGMPRAAVQLGAVGEVAPLDEIAGILMHKIRTRRAVLQLATSGS